MLTNLDQEKCSLGFESNLFQEKACYPERHLTQLHLHFRQYLRSRLHRVCHWWVEITVKFIGSYEYLADTGIFTEHPEFQGRAKFGASL